MSILNIWNITNKINVDLFNLNEYIISNKFLLNTDNINKCFLEKFIYDIAYFHFKRLNINFNKDEHYIEFYFTTSNECQKSLNNNEFHIENSELFLKTITYFTPFHIKNSKITSDNSSINEYNDYMDIITNITSDQYKYKNIFDNILFYISFPESFKHVSFEGNKYYHNKFASFNHQTNSIGSLNIEKSSNNLQILSLNINLWNKLPLNRYLFSNTYYSNDESYNTLNFVSEEINSIDYNYYLTNEFIEDIIYNPLSNTYNEIMNTQKKINTTSFILYKNENNLCKFEKNTNTKNITNKLSCNSINIHLPKFLQRFYFKNKLPKYMCNWIMNEYNSYIQLSNTTENNIDIEKIKSIFPLILELYNSIIMDIINFYSIDKKYIFIIDEIYIKKNNYIENNIDIKNRLEINILLSDIKDEYIFEDEICSNLEIGDMLIFKENSKFRKNEINHYCLIGKISIYTE